MANVEINDLTLEATLLVTDEIEIQKTSGGTSKKTTIQTVSTLVEGEIITNGTFTPTIVNLGDETYTTQYGEYYTVGDLVWVYMRFIVSSWGSVATGISLHVDNLPFNAASNDSTQTHGTLHVNTMAGASMGIGENIVAGVIDGSDMAQLLTWDATGGTSSFRRDHFNTGQIMEISGWYRKA